MDFFCLFLGERLFLLLQTIYIVPFHHECPLSFGFSQENVLKKKPVFSFGYDGDRKVLPLIIFFNLFFQRRIEG